MNLDLAGLLKQALHHDVVDPREVLRAFGPDARQGAGPGLARHSLAPTADAPDAPDVDQPAGRVPEPADPQHQAALLNQLLAGIGPDGLAALFTTPAGSALAAALAPQQADADGAVTLEQASRLSAVQLQQIVANAEQRVPGIIDRMSSLHAQHPRLTDLLGGAAVAIALARMRRAAD